MAALLTILLMLIAPLTAFAQGTDPGWPFYGGDAGGAATASRRRSARTTSTACGSSGCTAPATSSAGRRR